MQLTDYTKITELTDPDVIKDIDLTKCINLRKFKCPPWFTDEDIKKITPKLVDLDLTENELVTSDGINHFELRFPFLLTTVWSPWYLDKSKRKSPYCVNDPRSKHPRASSE